MPSDPFVLELMKTLECQAWAEEPDHRVEECCMEPKLTLWPPVPSVLFEAYTRQLTCTQTRLCSTTVHVEPMGDG